MSEISSEIGSDTDSEIGGEIDREQVTARNILESLRTGVPNSEAVMELKTTQNAIVDHFMDLINGVKNLSIDSSSSVNKRNGMLLSGGFGSGKSHVLEYLSQIAKQNNFVVSKVVISKETPLFDNAAVFKAAMIAAVVPGRRGNAIHEIARQLNFNSPAFANFYQWLNKNDSLDKRLAASLRLYEQYKGDEEFVDNLVQFWGGSKISIIDLKKRLREAGWLKEYQLVSRKEDLLAQDKFEFIAQLIKIAGYNGWVVMLDETELIGRYSILQRAKSYAQINKWLNGINTTPACPLVSVLTTVDDFEGEVLIGRDDYTKVPDKLLAKESPEYKTLAVEAKKGMKLISDIPYLLNAPDDDELNNTYQQIKKIHAEAFGWNPPDINGLERIPSNRMRQYVRAWINEWDLLYLDPSFKPNSMVDTVNIDLSEDVDYSRTVDDE